MPPPAGTRTTTGLRRSSAASSGGGPPRPLPHPGFVRTPPTAGPCTGGEGGRPLPRSAPSPRGRRRPPDRRRSSSSGAPPRPRAETSPPWRGSRHPARGRPQRGSRPSPEHTSRRESFLNRQGPPPATLLVPAPAFAERSRGVSLSHVLGAPREPGHAAGGPLPPPAARPPAPRRTVREGLLELSPAPLESPHRRFRTATPRGFASSPGTLPGSRQISATSSSPGRNLTCAAWARSLS